MLIGGIADGFEAAVFAGALVLPVVGEGFTGLPIEVYCPEADKVESATDGSFAGGFEFFSVDQMLHQATTSTGRVSTVRGKLFSAWT